MNIRKVLLSGGLRALAMSGLGRIVAPWTSGDGLVFTLHSVRPAAPDTGFAPNAHLEVTPEFLDATIRQVRAAGLEFVSLAEAMRRLDDGGAAGRFAVLTLDDGYRDNLDYAYPVLKRNGVPFTIFVTTGFVDRSSELWWIALERIVAAADQVEIPLGARMERLPASTAEEKCAAYCRARAWLSQDMSEAAQRLEIRRMAAAHGLDLAALADELTLSWDDLRRLVADPLVSIGAHTHDHFALARLSREDMAADVQMGLKRLEAELGIRPQHFAYPYGYEAAVDRRTVEVLGGFGFDCAVTTRPGVLFRGQQRERLALPRVSLNGHFQHATYVGQYLTGAPFPIYNWARGLSDRIGLRPHGRFSLLSGEMSRRQRG